MLDLPLFDFVNCQLLQQFESQFTYNLPKIADNNKGLAGHVDILLEDKNVSNDILLSDNSDTTLVLIPQASTRSSQRIRGLPPQDVIV